MNDRSRITKSDSNFKKFKTHSDTMAMEGEHRVIRLKFDNIQRVVCFS